MSRMRRGVYIMNGHINMKFKDEGKDNLGVTIDVDLENVGFADKCIAVDNLLTGLHVEGADRLELLAAVAAKSIVDCKGGNKDEG